MSKDSKPYYDLLIQIASARPSEREQLLEGSSHLINAFMIKLIETYVDKIGKKKDTNLLKTLDAVFRPVSQKFLLHWLTTCLDSTTEDSKLNWAYAHVMVGDVYRKLGRLRLNSRFSKAIESYTHALIVFTTPAYKKQFLELHDKIVKCCAETRDSNNLYWIDNALNHFGKMLDVLDPVGDASTYRRIRNSQAAWYLARAKQTGAADRQKAIECFNENAAGLQEGSYEWAVTQLNIGSAFFEMRPATKEWIAKAISHMELALPCFTREQTVEWAMCRYNLAAVYLQPLADPTIATYKKASQYLSEAGNYFLENERFGDWANIQLIKVKIEPGSEKRRILRSIALQTEVLEKAEDKLKPEQLIKIYNWLGFAFVQLASIENKGYRTNAYHYFALAVSKIRPEANMEQWAYAMCMAVSNFGKKEMSRQELSICRKSILELTKKIDPTQHAWALSLLYRALGDCNMVLFPEKEIVANTEPHYAKAVQLLKGAEHAPTRTQMQYQIGSHYFDSAHYDAAYPFLHGAMEFASKEKSPFEWADLNMKLGQCLCLMKKRNERVSWEEASSYLFEAERFFRANSFPLLSVQLYYSIGSFSYSTGRIELAHEYASKAQDAMAHLKSSEEDEATRQLISHMMSIVYNLLVLTNFEKLNILVTLENIVKAKSRLFVDKLTFPVRTFDDIKAAYPKSESLLREIRVTDQDIQINQKILRESILQIPSVEKEDSEKLQQHLLSNLNSSRIKLDQLYSRLLRDYPISASKNVSDPISLEEIAALQLEFPVIEYFNAGQYWLAAVVLKEQVMIVRLPDSTNAVLRRAVKRIDQFNTYAGRTETIALSAICQRFYACFIAPVREVIDSHEDLVIAPNDLMYKFPIGLAQYPDGRTFGEVHNISIVPSTAAAQVLRDRKPILPQRPKLLNLVVTGKAGKQPLLYAEKESRALRRIFQHDYALLQEEHATTTAFGEAFATESPDMIHLTCHGSFDPSFPVLSGLQLYDGDLTTNHIVHNIRFKKDPLIVLSACETGKLHVNKGDDLIGLTSAFFYAGASTVISSLWPVDDHATCLLFEIFYKQVKEGMSYARALKTAMAELKGMEAFKHPVYWAGFQLYGLPN